MQLELGKIVGVWGVKGWVKLHSYTRNRADIADYSSWWLKAPKEIDFLQSGNSIKVLACREQGQGIVAQLAGVDTRELAEQLIGCRIFIQQADLPLLPAGEFYWQQLIGLQVEDAAGQELGNIHSLLETGANDVLVVKPKHVSNQTEKKLDVLIPYIEQVVLEVDLETGLMRVDWDTSYLEE